MQTNFGCPYSFNFDADMKEVEVKAKLRNEQAVVDALRALGVELSAPISQEDMVYFPKDAVFAAEGSKDPALRIRKQNERIIFTYKKPDKFSLDKVEYETEITNAVAMAKICEALNFELRTHIRKIRRKAQYNEFEICLDEVEGLGAFIEIEKMIPLDGDSVAAQTELYAFLAQLGIQEADRVTKGYDILVYELNHQE